SGRRDLDAVAGLWCVAIGYGRTQVVDAMAAQSRKLALYDTFSSMSNEPQIRLADRLLGLVPGRMGKVFFGDSRSQASDRGRSSSGTTTTSSPVKARGARERAEA